jgi:NitT/TauT family transport system permease protein
VLFLLVWQFASGTVVPKFFISSPSAIYLSLQSSILSGQFFSNMAVTALEAFLGFTIGAALGVLAGIALGRSAMLAEFFNPFIIAFYSLPKVALAPLFILWLGIGLNMKVTLTASIVFFLVFFNTFSGVRNVSQELIAILRLMGASQRQVLTKVVLPSAITWVFAGLRISVPYALIGAIVGELIASNRGLGAMLSQAQGQFDTAGVFAALFGIVILSSILNLAVKIAEVKLMPWKQQDTTNEIRL